MNRKLAAVKRSFQAAGRKVLTMPQDEINGKTEGAVICLPLRLPDEEAINYALSHAGAPFSAVVYLAGNLLYLAVPNIDHIGEEDSGDDAAARRALLLSLSFDSGLVRGSVDAIDGEVRLISTLPGPLAASWGPDALLELERALAEYLRLIGNQRLELDMGVSDYLQ